MTTMAISQLSTHDTSEEPCKLQQGAEKLLSCASTAKSVGKDVRDGAAVPFE